MSFTGEPGHSAVDWKSEPYATGYVPECGDDPNDPASFTYKATTRDPHWDGNGAIPGKLCYFRAAAVNRLGQGPWSEPAQRPVM